MSDQKPNRLSVGLRMKHDEEDHELSTASLNIDYPSLGRNVANIVQYTTIAHVLVSNIRLACDQAMVEHPEDLPMFVNFLAEMSETFGRLAESYSPPKEQAVNATPSGVMRSGPVR
jgi:hypothetical protein